MGKNRPYGKGFKKMEKSIRGVVDITVSTGGQRQVIFHSTKHDLKTL